MKTVKSRLANKKGFTLVEIIVVLVIIAILAAAAVPTMIGYVEDARGKAYAAEARVGFVAAQAAITEILAAQGTITDAANTGTTACGITYVIPGDSSAQLVDHPTFVELTGGVTSGAVFNRMDLDSTGKQISTLTFHSRGLIQYAHYDVIVNRDGDLETKRITAAADHS